MAVPCPICGTQSDIAVGQAEARRLLICPECRHVYWEGTTSPEQLRAYYEREYSEIHQQDATQESNRTYYRRHFAELGAMLSDAESGRPIRCIVDFGCSYPVFLEEARAAGAERVVGVDFSLGVRQAGALTGVEMWDPEAFLEKFDDKIDIIRFSHVIEHLPHPVSTFSAATAHLAPGGIAYVTQPIFPVLKARPASLEFKDAGFPEHLHFFNPLSMYRLITGAGLKVEQFYASHDEEAVRSLYESSVDLDLAEDKLPPGLGRNIPSGFSPLGARPTFYGRNCTAIARKPNAAQAPARSITTAAGPADIGDRPPMPPSAQQLRELVNEAKYAEAVALLDRIDMGTDRGADFAYYAGVALGSVGEAERAIDLLKRAAASGYAAFWCAYHLGLFEIKRGNRADAAHYLSVALVLDPAKAEIYSLLEQVAPNADLRLLRAAARGVAPEPEVALAEPAARGAPSVSVLRALAGEGKHAEATALLDGVDLAAAQEPDLLYHAGVCLGTVGQHERAIDLLIRAAIGGFAKFWCTYHLGLFEMRRGRAAQAACYFALSLLLDAQRDDLYKLLEEVAPKVDTSLLREAQRGVGSADAVRAALDLAALSAAAERAGAAAFYCTTALGLEPGNVAARLRLLDLAPDIPLALLPSA